MQTKITNLSSLHCSKSIVTLDTLRSDAKLYNSPQVICVAQVVSVADDACRWIVVCPGGAIMGASTRYSYVDAYILADDLARMRGWAAPTPRMGEVGK